MKTLRIEDRVTWSWKKRLASFITVFGIIWLFVDPFLAFVSGTSFFVLLGMTGYIGLIVISIILVVSIEIFAGRQKLGKSYFIKLNITLVENGKQILVEAPKDMLVMRFLKLFLSEISKESDEASNLSRHNLYVPTLMVLRGEGYEDVSWFTNRRDGRVQEITLNDAGLRDLDECRIRGEVREPDILFEL